MAFAAGLIWFAKAYAAVGAVAAAAFLMFGIDRVDASAKGSYAFRPLLVPGTIILWPLVIWRWYQLEQTPSDTGAE